MDFSTDIYFITDEEGNRTHVILPLHIYEETVAEHLSGPAASVEAGEGDA